MANVFSTIVTNFRATPLVKASQGSLSGRMRIANETVRGTPATGDVWYFYPLPTNARIHSILAYWDDLGTTVPFDVGLYSTASTPAVVDIDAYASALVGGTVQATALDVAYEARDYAVAARQLWEDVAPALTADPGGLYYLAATFGTVTGGSAGVDIKLVTHYTID